MIGPSPNRLTVKQAAGCCIGVVVVIVTIVCVWLWFWERALDNIWGVNATTEDASTGKGRFSREALMQNFHVHEAEFEAFRRMLVRDAERYQSVSATGEDGSFPESITLGNSPQAVPQDLEREYVVALKDLGITSVSVRPGDRDLDLLVASWGLSVAGGSLSYVYSEKAPKDENGSCCETTYVPLGEGWYLRDEGH